MTELRRRGIARVSLVGLRFGATIAALACDADTNVDTLVAWDPVVSGRRYSRELKGVEVVALKTPDDLDKARALVAEHTGEETAA